jgi:hypothetical protein
MRQLGIDMHRFDTEFVPLSRRLRRNAPPSAVALLSMVLLTPALAFGQWQGWENLSTQNGGSTVASAPTVIQVGGGPEIYAVHPNTGTLFFIHPDRSTPPRWIWEDVARNIKIRGKPECVAWQEAGSYRVDCFAPGDGPHYEHAFRRDPITGNVREVMGFYHPQVWHVARINGLWTDWDMLPGEDISKISVVIPVPGTFKIFALQSDGLMIQNEFNGSGWSGWFPVALGQIGSAPSCVTLWIDVNQIDCFARASGASNALVHNPWNGRSFNGWQAVDGAPPILAGTVPSATHGPNPGYDVFYSGPDYKMQHVWKDSNGLQSETLDGNSTSYSCARIGQNRIDCVALSFYGLQIMHNTWLKYPAYNQVYGIATHNSYWINRGDQQDWHSSGTQELMMDQLLHDHARALEIDIHSNNVSAGDWLVYHTSRSEDFSCKYLSDCLQLLRNFQYAIPRHEVVNVIIELKNVDPLTDINCPGSFDTCSGLNAVPTDHNFDPGNGHSMQDFDNLFRSILGDGHLYTPRDFLARCMPRSTLVECARTAGWPTIAELRGKFIINIIGNWSTAAYDWAQYAGDGDVGNRIAFPLASIISVGKDDSTPQFTYVHNWEWVFQGLDLNSLVQVDANEYDPQFKYGPFAYRTISRQWALPKPQPSEMWMHNALDASIFWQLEGLSVPPTGDEADAAMTFLSGNGIVRAGDSFEYYIQADRINSNFQLIQTDYPWYFVHDEGPAPIPTDPSQRLRDRAWLTHVAPLPNSPFHEPGARLYFHTERARGYTWAYSTVPTVAQRWWEATASTTRHGDTYGKDPAAPSSSGFAASDYIQTCPTSNPLAWACSNYPRRALEEGEGNIKVSSEIGDEGMQIARQKNTPGGPTYFQEAVDLYVRVYHHGQQETDQQYKAPRYGPCRRKEDPNSDDGTGVSWMCIGSMIALSVDNFGSGSVVRVYSAGELNPTGVPDWHLLAQESFKVPMTKQGFSASQDVLFAGPRMATSLNGNGTPPDGTALVDVALADLPGYYSDDNGVVIDLSY